MTRLLQVLVLVTGFASSASAQDVTYAYTQFDADKGCKHTPSRVEEDYGSWQCPGYAGIAVRLSAGDQRMQVSFGPRANKEVAAGETLPAFNNAYKGTVEWRSVGGKPFATILRWNVMMPDDERQASGRVLVVTRLNPGGVCHVAYVDARTTANPNEVARKLADEKARSFKCGVDKAEYVTN